MKPRLPQPKRLDVATFARDGGRLAGELTAAETERLRTSEYAPTASDAAPRVAWAASGELRATGAGAAQPWLHLSAQGEVPQVCQRCLEPMVLPVHVDRWFRFVADEALADELDVDAEEEILAVTSTLDLPTLVEDEILLALPVVPRHDSCPHPVAAPPDPPATTEAPPDHPFAALRALKAARDRSAGD